MNQSSSGIHDNGTRLKSEGFVRGRDNFFSAWDPQRHGVSLVDSPRETASFDLGMDKAPKSETEVFSSLENNLNTMKMPGVPPPPITGLFHSMNPSRDHRHISRNVLPPPGPPLHLHPSWAVPSQRMDIAPASVSNAPPLPHNVMPAGRPSLPPRVFPNGQPVMTRASAARKARVRKLPGNMSRVPVIPVAFDSTNSVWATNLTPATQASLASIRNPHSLNHIFPSGSEPAAKKARMDLGANTDAKTPQKKVSNRMLHLDVPGTMTSSSSTSTSPSSSPVPKTESGLGMGLGAKPSEKERKRLAQKRYRDRKRRMEQERLDQLGQMEQELKRLAPFKDLKAIEEHHAAIGGQSGKMWSLVCTIPECLVLSTCGHAEALGYDPVGTRGTDYTRLDKVGGEAAQHDMWQKMSESDYHMAKGGIDAVREYFAKVGCSPAVYEKKKLTPNGTEWIWVQAVGRPLSAPGVTPMIYQVVEMDVTPAVNIAIQMVLHGGHIPESIASTNRMQCNVEPSRMDVAPPTLSSSPTVIKRDHAGRHTDPNKKRDWQPQSHVFGAQIDVEPHFPGIPQDSSTWPTVV